MQPGVMKAALIEALHSLGSSFFNSAIVLGGLIPSRESCVMHEISTFGMAVAKVIHALIEQEGYNSVRSWWLTTTIFRLFLREILNGLSTHCAIFSIIRTVILT